MIVETSLFWYDFFICIQVHRLGRCRGDETISEALLFKLGNGACRHRIWNSDGIVDSGKYYRDYFVNTFNICWILCVLFRPEKKILKRGVKYENCCLQATCIFKGDYQTDFWR